MVNNMGMTINGETFTTFNDIWEASNLTQAEKDEIQLKIALVGYTLAIVPDSQIQTTD